MWVPLDVRSLRIMVPKVVLDLVATSPRETEWWSPIDRMIPSAPFKLVASETLCFITSLEEEYLILDTDDLQITWTSDIADGSSSKTNSSILTNGNPSPLIFNANMTAFSWNGPWLKTENGGRSVCIFVRRSRGYGVASYWLSHHRSTSAIGACVNLTFEVRYQFFLRWYNFLNFLCYHPGWIHCTTLYTI